MNHQQFKTKLLLTAPNLYREMIEEWPSDISQLNFDSIPEQWYDIIINMSKKLEKEILKIDEPFRQGYRAEIIRKFNDELRFFMTSETGEMSQHILKAYAQVAKLGVESE